MSVVSFERVTKRFGEVTALDEFNLVIDEDELLVLLGPSGCGKSTALRIIAGLDEPSSGLVRINDEIVNDVDPKDRDVAMVFQSYALYPHKTVEQNIAFPLKARKVPKDEIASRVKEVVDQLGLTDLTKRKPRELSGGQRQRVALARALVRRPAVFLMDEPLSNLDAKLRTQTRAELVELQQRLHTSFIYVTHDQVEAMTMASRIAILFEGSLQQLGTAQEIYDSPENVFVAQFIGSPPMNIISGSLHDGAGSIQGAGAGAIQIGVRPEDLRLAGLDEQLDRSVLSLPAQVRLIEALGHERHVICGIEDGTSVVLRVQSGDHCPSENEAIRLVADSHSLHFFSSADGKRLST